MKNGAIKQQFEAIELEGPDTVAAVFLEPVQNAGGCFPPPEGYFQRVREICVEYDVLLVSDEVICAFDQVGEMFAFERLFEPFAQDATFYHGYTFGGHPVSAAVAMATPEKLLDLPTRSPRRRSRARRPTEQILRGVLTEAGNRI